QSNAPGEAHRILYFRGKVWPAACWDTFRPQRVNPVLHVGFYENRKYIGAYSERKFGKHGLDFIPFSSPLRELEVMRSPRRDHSLNVSFSDRNKTLKIGTAGLEPIVVGINGTRKRRMAVSG